MRCKDGSRKIGEIHFNRTNYREFNKRWLPGFVNRFITCQWFNNLITQLKRLDPFVVLSEEDYHNWPEITNKIVIPNSLSYYPDFLVELDDGKFYIVEIKGENLIDRASTQAKIQYAKEMYNASGLEYVFIPSRYADMILQEFINQSRDISMFNTEKATDTYTIVPDYGLLNVASSDSSIESK